MDNPTDNPAPEPSLEEMAGLVPPNKFEISQNGLGEIFVVAIGAAFKMNVSELGSNPKRAIVDRYLAERK